MLKDVDLGGIYLAALVLHLLLAAVLFFACRGALGRIRLLGRVWYLALFEAALFVVVFALLLPFV